MAAQPKFRLDPVLEHRKRLTDEARQVFAVRSREYQDAVEALEALHQERADLLDSVGRMQLSGQIDVSALAAAESVDVRLRLMADFQEQAVMAAEVRASEARVELVERRMGEKGAGEAAREAHRGADTSAARA
jgi:flagellar export protein FliJ